MDDRSRGAWLHDAPGFQVEVRCCEVLRGEVPLDSASCQSMDDAIDWALARLSEVCGDPEFWPVVILKRRLEILRCTPVASSGWSARRGKLAVLMWGC